MTMEKMKIEHVPVGDLKPYKGNAKLHPDAQVREIAKSIDELGFNDPLATWHGEVVEGHGRLLAVKMLNERYAGEGRPLIEAVPVICLDRLTDEERRAYALIHNKTTMDSGFDEALLFSELDALLGSGIDMEGFEFPDPTAEPLGGKNDPGKELDVDDFGDGKFQCQCPKCGFRFNPDA